MLDVLAIKQLFYQGCMYLVLEVMCNEIFECFV